MALKWDWFLKSFRVKDNGTGGTPAGSNGQVQFNDNDSFGADSNFFWDNTNKRLGIGTSTPLASLHIEGGDAFFRRESGLVNNIAASYNNVTAQGSRFTFRKSGGSVASPTAILLDWTIGDIRYGGTYDTSGTFYNACIFGTMASENWDASNRGVKFFIDGTKNGNTARNRWFEIENGQFTALEIYNTTVGGTNRDLYIDDTGLIGYVSSALKYKENIRDISASEIENIFNIPVKKFDYKNTEKGINQIGIIAEDMKQYFPELCSYKYEYVEETQQDSEGNNVLVKIPVLDEQGNHINEIETVQYSKVGLLALLAVKNLDERLKVLENV